MADEKTPKAPEAFSMKEVYVFITNDPQGNEGVVAVINPNGQMQPLISFDGADMEPMTNAAQQIADETKQDIKLIKFDNREELNTIEPRRIHLVQPSQMPGNN
jgi:hypothetical protein